MSLTWATEQEKDSSSLLVLRSCCRVVSASLNDLGYDSAERALRATLQMEFYPALRDEEPVAVWIVIPIRMEFILYYPREGFCSQNVC